MAPSKSQRRKLWKNVRGQEVTIIHHETGQTWEMSKVLLMQHSGFFNAMFSHNFMETCSGVVTLHEDNPVALDYLMRYITKPGEIDETKMEREFRRANNIEDGYYVPKDDDEELFLLRLLHDEMLEFWIVANKYDVSSHICRHFAEQFERLCSWSHDRSSSGFGWMYGRRSLFQNPEDFLQKHYIPLTERLGGVYPPELYGIYTYHIQFFEMQAFGAWGHPSDHSAKERHHLCYHLIETAYQDQGLSLHISKSFLRKIRKFEDDQPEDSWTDRWFYHQEATAADLRFKPKKMKHNSGRGQIGWSNLRSWWGWNS